MHTESRLLDHVIGEAALTLLVQKKRISLAFLLKELRIMEANSADALLSNACKNAITWLEERCSSAGIEADPLSETEQYKH